MLEGQERRANMGQVEPFHDERIGSDVELIVQVHQAIAQRGGKQDEGQAEQKRDRKESGNDPRIHHGFCGSRNRERGPK